MIPFFQGFACKCTLVVVFNLCEIFLVFSFLNYRIAVEANLPSVQLSALENMHYSHMIRFDNIEEAR